MSPSAGFESRQSGKKGIQRGSGAPRFLFKISAIWELDVAGGQGIHHRAETLGAPHAEVYALKEPWLLLAVDEKNTPDRTGLEGRAPPTCTPFRQLLNDSRPLSSGDPALTGLPTNNLVGAP